MSVPEQIPMRLDYPSRNDLESFLTADANFAAYTAVMAWRTWPDARMILSGPAGCGKSHLGAIWCADSGAARVTATMIRPASVPELAAHPALLIEDADRIGDLDSDLAREAEHGLFHLLNLTAPARTPLMITGAAAPGYWRFATADVTSRLCAFAHVRIGAPDDALLSSILHKLFADRRISVPDDVIVLLLQRIPRSVIAARRIVEQIDTFALARRRRVTRRLVIEALGGVGVVTQDLREEDP